MPIGGQHVRQVVEEKRRLVAEHAKLLRPEPKGNEILVVTRREMGQAQDAPADPFEPAGAHVILKQRQRVARLGGLLGRDVARLGGGRLVQPIPRRDGAI